MPVSPQSSPKSKADGRLDSRPVSPRSQARRPSEAATAPTPPIIRIQSSSFRTPATPNPISISTPSLASQDKSRHDSLATTASISSAATMSTSPGTSASYGTHGITYPHPRDLTPKGRRNSLSHSDERPTERVAELTAKFRVSIPVRRGSNASEASTSSISLAQTARETEEAKAEEATKKRKELGRKLALALEKGDVVVAPASTIDEKKLREVRLDSAVNLGSSKEVPMRLSTCRSNSGTESGDIRLRYPNASADPKNSADATQEGEVREEVILEREATGRGEGGVPDIGKSEIGRTTGGPSSNPGHRLGRRNSSLAMATAKAAGVKRVVIAPPPGSRGFGKSNLLRDGEIPSMGGDATGDGRLSHAALLRLPPAAAAAKSQALLSEGPLPRRRKSSAKLGQKERERSRSRERKGLSLSGESTVVETSEDEDMSSEEGGEWDEESLLELTDWWRQVLAAGATPSPKEMAMMDSFLAEFLKEDMPDLHMVLRTRLHRLLVAIIDGAEIRGEGEDEERFHELARKASLLERRWMKATRGRLFGMEKERRDIMFGKSGRLNMVKPWSKDENETRWVTERNEKAGMADAETGAWWLNTTCAYRDGMIGNTSGYVSNFKQHAHPTLVLEVGEEFPTSNISITRYINEGTIYYMLLPLMSCLDRPIRVLRNWTLKSKLAPPAGLRFDGWYSVLSFSHKRISMEEDIFRVEVLIERKKDQITMARLLMIPSPSMLDEWEEYLAIRDDEMRREKSLEEYEEWHRRQREGELERELWLCERAEEEACAVEGGGAEVVEAWGYPSN